MTKLDNNDTTADPTSQPKTQWLITPGVDITDDWPICPYAAVLDGWSLTIGRHVAIWLSCKRWGCPVCGRRRIAHLARRTRDAEPHHFLTLTVDPKLYPDPRAAYDASRKKIPHLVTKIRRVVTEFEYLRILEVTHAGWPHYHFCARTSYISQHWLSDEWHRLTGAKIVDIRYIKNPRQSVKYILKYLCKQKEIQWTNRRATWSRHFFRDPADWEPLDLNLQDPRRWTDHPTQWLRWFHCGSTIQKITPNVAVFVPPGLHR